MIIIGTGAGGGTLAHRLAPSGKRILLLERGGYLPREPENWDSQRGVPRRTATVTGETWYDKDDTPFRAARAVLRRGQHEGLRGDPVPVPRAGLRRGPAPRRASLRVAPLVRGPRAVLRRGGEALPRPRAGRRGPHRAARARARSLSGRLARAADPGAPRRPRARRGSSRSTCPSGSTSTSPTRRRGRCVRCDRFDGFPCLTDGKADAHVLCVRPALEHPNVTLLTHSKVLRLETERPARSVTRVVVDRGASRRRTARTSSSSRAGR